ncbi:MAG: hypothetical protein ACI4PI_00680, partial [Oscillospiraceae bacterium]
FKTPLGRVVLVLSLVVVLLLLALFIFMIRARNKAKKNNSAQQESVPEMTLEEFMNSTTPNNETQVSENSLQNMNEQLELDTADRQNNDSSAETSMQQEPDNERVEKQENNVLENVLKFVDENSEIASQFIKSWIRSEDVTKDD